MTIELLIQSIVRQTTVLIGQLATAGGTRAPLAPVAGQVFLDLVHELERQGVSRKVSADMFGMSLRTYQRKIQRLTESSTHHGRSLWEAVLDFVQSEGTTRRAQVLLYFARDDESQVRGVLHDLCESGLVTASGTGASLEYRITPEEELAALRQSSRNEGLDELLWALVYREGPLTREQLGERHFDGPSLDDALERLVVGGRVERTGETYRASTLVVPLGSTLGWEAAVFDHYQALVNTITCRLRVARTAPSLTDRVGGSTYTFEIWPGHPLEQEAYATLATVRERLSDLRRRIEAHNAKQPAAQDPVQVLFYAGQCVIDQDAPGSDDQD